MFPNWLLFVCLFCDACLLGLHAKSLNNNNDESQQKYCFGLLTVLCSDSFVNSYLLTINTYHIDILPCSSLRVQPFPPLLPKLNPFLARCNLSCNPPHYSDSARD